MTHDKGAEPRPGAQTMDKETSGAAPGAPREIDSAGLFAGRNEVIIVHNGGRYRLRITRQDKLILNK